MRRQFSLPESEMKCLEQSGCQWEAIRDLNCLWVLIHGFAVPAGYNYQQVIAAVMIPDSYPDTSLDMVYFSPDLARLDGRAIRAICQQTIDGKSFHFNQILYLKFFVFSWHAVNVIGDKLAN